MRYIDEGIPLDCTTAWLDMARWLGHWQLRGYGTWSVEETVTGQLIGRAGLFHPYGCTDAAVNWIIADTHWGQDWQQRSPGRVGLRWA